MGIQSNTKEIVNLSSYQLSAEEEMVLLNGLSFYPDQELNVFDCITDINLFARKVLLKVFLDKSKIVKPNYSEMSKGFTVADFRALKDLILLMQEN